MAAKRGPHMLIRSLSETHLFLALSQIFFMGQQPRFAPDSGTEADQFAVTANHTVTGNNKGNPVLVVGIAHGAKGPGIADVELAMTDGYTSSAGMGYGLPGAKRLVDDFYICTVC